MIKIEILDPTAETRNKKDGKGTYRLQHGYVQLPDFHFPQRINLFVRPGESPLPIGCYTLLPSSFRVVNGYLELGYINLAPDSSAKKS